LSENIAAVDKGGDIADVYDALNLRNLADDLDFLRGASYNLAANITSKVLLSMVVPTFTPGVNGRTACTSATLKFRNFGFEEE